jgi:tRNA dimethylallyltransferase
LGRIVRALEVYLTTGRTITEQVKASRTEPPFFDTCLLVLDFRDRERLYDRIHRRVDSMVENGLLEEARRVLKSPYAPTAMQAIGYKELRPYFDGELSLEEALDNLKKSTRHYAKRQLSWFRRIPYAQFLYVDEYADITALTDAAITLTERKIP